MSIYSSIVRAIAIGAVAAVICTGPVWADVTGSFETHISIRPQTTVSEVSLIDFDVENALDVTFSISGLMTHFHTHFGIAGVEDVILNSSATLGALEVNALLVYGRFEFGSLVPFYDSLHFIKKAVSASIQLGGVSFTTLGQFEDTNAFISQTPAYAFGMKFDFSGQTPSGVTVSGKGIGFCMLRVPNSIKKHFALTPYTVNPDCATTPKPDVLFDSWVLVISGVPVGPSVTGSTTISCVTINACEVVTDLTFSGGPVPIIVSLTFEDLLSILFGGATITLQSGAGTLGIDITPQGTIGAVSVNVVATLNPDTNPAMLAISATAVPGSGLTDAAVELSIQKAPITFAATASFAGGPPAQFQEITFDLAVDGSLLDIESSATFANTGLQIANLWFTVNF